MHLQEGRSRRRTRCDGRHIVRDRLIRADAEDIGRMFLGIAGADAELADIGKMVDGVILRLHHRGQEHAHGIVVRDVHARAVLSQARIALVDDRKRLRERCVKRLVHDAVFVARRTDLKIDRAVFIGIADILRGVLCGVLFGHIADVVVILLGGDDALGIVHRGIAAADVRAHIGVRAVCKPEIRILLHHSHDGAERLHIVRPVRERDGADKAQNGDHQRVYDQQDHRFSLAHCLLLKKREAGNPP